MLIRKRTGRGIITGNGHTARRRLPMTQTLLFAVFAAVLASDDAAEPHGAAAPPKFTCTLDKAKDACAFPDGQGVMLRITSESGIGGARLILAEGEAPRRLTLPFPKMWNLEA